MCIVHDKVIRGIVSVEAEILRDYYSKYCAFAFITFEINNDNSTQRFKQYIGRRIEKQKSIYTIKENIAGSIIFLY